MFTYYLHIQRFLTVIRLCFKRNKGDSGKNVNKATHTAVKDITNFGMAV